jgi:very-short-patch-repair endonuclease
MRGLERETLKRAKVLRSRMTDAEVILWSRLRGRRLGPYRFRRQHPIGPYIADFACVMHRLVVEVDGGTHSTDEEIAYDCRRERYLSTRGWYVFRVTNEDVYKRLDMVLEGICLHMPPPRPSAGPPP